MPWTPVPPATLLFQIRIKLIVLNVFEYRLGKMFFSYRLAVNIGAFLRHNTVKFKELHKSDDKTLMPNCHDEKTKWKITRFFFHNQENLFLGCQKHCTALRNCRLKPNQKCFYNYTFALKKLKISEELNAASLKQKQQPRAYLVCTAS